MMTINFLWLAKCATIGLLLLGAICSIYMIGKPREPITPGSAVFTVVSTALIIWFIAATCQV